MTKEKTIMQALTEVVPNYLASYLCWYYSDPNKESVGKNSVNLMLTLEVKAVGIKQKILQNRTGSFVMMFRKQ